MLWLRSWLFEKEINKSSRTELSSISLVEEILNNSFPVELIDKSEESSVKISSKISLIVSNDSKSLVTTSSDLSIIKISPSKKSTLISASFTSGPRLDLFSRNWELLLAEPVTTVSGRSSSVGAFSLIKSVTVGVTKDLNNLKTGASKNAISLSLFS